MLEVVVGLWLGLCFIFMEWMGVFWNPGLGMNVLSEKLLFYNVLVLIGAFVMANVLRNFAIRIPPGRQLVKGIVGGIFLATGTLVASGGNIGAFLIPLLNLSASAFLFLLGMIIGLYIGVKIEVKELDKLPRSGGIQVRLPKLNYILAAIGLVLGIYLIKAKPLLGIFLILGASLQLGRWCMVNAFREPFFSKEITTSIAVGLTMIVGVIGVAVLKFKGLVPASFGVLPTFGWQEALGGLLFGLGMGICGAGSEAVLWRTGEGDLKYLVSLITFVGVLTLEKSFVSKLKVKLTAVSVYLPKVIGLPASIGAVLAVPLLWYVIVFWNKKTKKLVKRYF